MSKGSVSGGDDGLYTATIEKTDGTTETKQAWCADLTEDLSGNVGIIEIAGDISKGVNVQPGYDGAASYNAARDGEMYEVPQPPGSQHSAGVYWNWAMRDGWQKWKPNYRYGTISNIDYEAHTGDVSLEACLSTDNSLDVNQSSSLSAVPIEYMSCNSAAFEDADEVIVKFENNSWDSPKVIGFKKEPKGCGQWIIVMINSGSCTVLNLKTGEVGTNIPTNAGPDAVFPCRFMEISDWISELTEISADDLFEKETNPEPSWPSTNNIEPVYDGTNGECGRECEEDFWHMGTTTRALNQNNVVESLWGDEQTANMSYSNVAAYGAGCGPSCANNMDYWNTDTTWQKSKHTKSGFKITPKNGGSVIISFWKEYEYEENHEYSFYGPYSGWAGDMSVSAGKSSSYIFGGENYYLTPPEAQSHVCTAGPCSSHYDIDQHPVYSNPCAYDWYGSTPYECTPEEIGDIDSWPRLIYYNAHYFDENNTKGIIQIFSYLPEDLEDMQVYVSIGDDPNEEPFNVPQNAAATSAVLALMQTGATPLHARITSVKYYQG